MLPREFTGKFNEAVKGQDWKLVIDLGEQAVAEHFATPDVLYNLGFAYLQSNNAAMASAVFLAIPENERDSKSKVALTESLRRSSASNDDLSLDAHGFKGALVALSESVPTRSMQATTMIGLALLIILFVLHISNRVRRVRRVFNSLLIVSIIAIAMGGISLCIQYFYAGHWGAIIADGPSSIYVKPDETAEVARTMNSGKPVLVLGQVKGPWLRVLDADGVSGWARSLDVRVIAD